MSLTWRSPAMLPPPVDPASVTPPSEPLPRLALGAAWRSRAFGHALAHGLRRVPGGEHHRAVARRIERALLASDAFLAHPALADAAGAEESERLVQARLRLEPLPNCESWAEVAMADLVYGGALDQQVRALADSREPALAAAARAVGEDMPASFGEPIVRALAEDPPNRPCLQILVDRWMASACHVFGRPGSAGDSALAPAGVRPLAMPALAEHLARIEATLFAMGLEATDAQFMGIVAPEGWAPRRQPRKRAPH